jgi:hypothetical protein
MAMQAPTIDENVAEQVEQRDKARAEVGYLMIAGAPDLPTLADFLRRPAWMARAACRGHDQAPFFAERGQTVLQRQAAELCARCPVREECREYALAQGLTLKGYWGGMSERQRKKLWYPGTVR